MKAIYQTGHQIFPLDWVDLEFYPNSNGHKIEIYLKNNFVGTSDLLDLFMTLFGDIKTSIQIFSDSWWDYCLDTWNFNENTINYDLEGKSAESIEYLRMLTCSEIEMGYSGVCECLNWDVYLRTTINCIMNRQAPQGHLLFSAELNFFFYFHYSGSIGFFYKTLNDEIRNIISKAEDRMTIIR